MQTLNQTKNASSARSVVGESIWSNSRRAGVPSAVDLRGSSSLIYRGTRYFSFSWTGIFNGLSLYSVKGESSSDDSPITHSLNQRRQRGGGLASRSACSRVM